MARKRRSKQRNVSRTHQQPKAETGERNKIKGSDRRTAIIGLFGGAAGFVMARVGEKLVDQAFAGSFTALAIYKAFIEKDREPVEMQVRMVNNTKETVLATEVEFQLHAVGAPIKEARERSKTTYSENYAIGLPDVQPGRDQSRSIYVSHSLAPGEPDAFKVKIYPQRHTQVSIKGVYVVRPVLKTTAGHFELETTKINVGRSVLETNAIPRQLFLESPETGETEVLDSGL